MARSLNCQPHPDHHNRVYHSRCRALGCDCDCHGMRGCPITVPANEEPIQRGGTGKAERCDKPLAPGARFCAKHEADRIRLS